MEKEILNLFEIYPLELNTVKIVSIFLCFIISIFIVYLLFKIRLKILAFPKRKKIEKINLSNPKETAYKITFLIREFETPYNEELLKRLEKYKYRKKVENLDIKTVNLIKKFLEYIK